MRGRIRLFWRLMIKPLASEPVRTTLTIFAVALGVAVVLAMDLAGEAATGSFHSSLETLSGEQSFEITANGGVPEEIVGKLDSAPFSWRVSPRMEDYAVDVASKKTLPLIGLDLIGELNRLEDEKSAASGLTESIAADAKGSLEQLIAKDSIWVGKSLGRHAGDRIELLINDRPETYTVRGVYADASGGESAVVPLRNWR
jgi:putative ABC transport system permease protein